MLIVYYHNVVNDPLDEFDRKLSRLHVDEFARQMRRLAEEFRPVSLEEMLSMMAEGESDPKAVAVTFDDGYYGVVRRALPVMNEFGVPATVFVVTDYVRENDGGPRLMHFDELEVSFRLTSAATLDLGFAGERPSRLSSAHARVDAMKRLKKRMKLMPDAERRRLHGEVLDRLGVSPEEAAAYAASEEKFRTAAWDELRESKGAGLSVGSHTCSHRVLSRLERGELEDEVLRSFARLREELGPGALPFAYPYGSEDSIGAEAPVLASRAGYSCGLTTVQGRNTPELNPFLLKRVEFEALDWPW